MSPWLAGWLAWGGMFLVIETLALLNDDKPGERDTLSQHVWWFRDNVKGGRVMLALGLGWLSLHLLFG